MKNGYLREVDIKSDLPAAEDAVKRVAFHIRHSKELGAGAVKFIHGYGSTGAGGKIRKAVRQHLEEQKEKRKIRGLIHGETFSIFDEETREAFRWCSDLRNDNDLDRHNNGITIVVL